MTAIPSLPREAVAPPMTPAPEDDTECLATEIRSTFSCIKTLCEEYMCQSAEMLGELDEPPPRLIAKRELLSAAWTSVGALAEKGDGHTERLEELIAPIRRGESPRPQPPGGTESSSTDAR